MQPFILTKGGTNLHKKIVRSVFLELTTPFGMISYFTCDE
ncbi:hypothetical protein pah_c221o001 [Parachlamydia acanthamoebae str. Hall's coccus]|nr:hypothetical protein pah_c221o001 [Parachlamydia acanthamoebae str. Hall's coccus]